ncbi:MAG: FHA domain-containing protein [Acidobacteriota bacterium]|nr:FHA domain-containing protein [Acidobacteriota bacterium]
MQVVLQGSLRYFPAAELLAVLCARGKNGTLDCEIAGRRVRVFFQRDKLVWADGQKDARPSEVILDLLGWTDGKFTLVDEAAVPDNVTLLALDLAPLLDEAKRRAQSSSRFPDATLFRVVDDPALQQQVSLTADAFKILFRVGAGKTFADLVNDLGMERQQLADSLDYLMKLGLIATPAAEPPTEPFEPLKEPEPQATAPQPKVANRRKTLVGSLTPDAMPDTVYPLLDSEYTIGRAATNGIVIADGSVSSTHARITRTADGFVLEDLQSRNGTFVNGEKVTAKRILTDGDLIRLGKIIMTFNVARQGSTGEATQPEVRLQ